MSLLSRTASDAIAVVDVIKRSPRKKCGPTTHQPEISQSPPQIELANQRTAATKALPIYTDDSQRAPPAQLPALLRSAWLASPTRQRSTRPTPIEPAARGGVVTATVPDTVTDTVTVTVTDTASATVTVTDTDTVTVTLPFAETVSVNVTVAVSVTNTVAVTATVTNTVTVTASANNCRKSSRNRYRYRY